MADFDNVFVAGTSCTPCGQQAAADIFGHGALLKHVALQAAAIEECVVILRVPLLRLPHCQ
jgi:hypothetical protein